VGGSWRYAQEKLQYYSFGALQAPDPGRISVAKTVAQFAAAPPIRPYSESRLALPSKTPVRCANVSAKPNAAIAKQKFFLKFDQAYEFCRVASAILPLPLARAQEARPVGGKPHASSIEEPTPPSRPAREAVQLQCSTSKPHFSNLIEPIERV